MCLGKNTYSPEKCESHLRELYECCRRMYDKREVEGGEELGSTACPAPRVVKRWLKEHPPAGTGTKE